jgi:hypothetical protein
MIPCVSRLPISSGQTAIPLSNFLSSGEGFSTPPRTSIREGKNAAAISGADHERIAELHRGEAEAWSGLCERSGEHSSDSHFSFVAAGHSGKGVTVRLPADETSQQIGGTR